MKHVKNLVFYSVLVIISAFSMTLPYDNGNIVGYAATDGILRLDTTEELPRFHVWEDDKIELYGRISKYSEFQETFNERIIPKEGEDVRATYIENTIVDVGARLGLDEDQSALLEKSIKEAKDPATTSLRLLDGIRATGTDPDKAVVDSIAVYEDGTIVINYVDCTKHPDHPLCEKIPEDDPKEDPNAFFNPYYNYNSYYGMNNQGHLLQMRRTFG